MANPRTAIASQPPYDAYHIPVRWLTPTPHRNQIITSRLDAYLHAAAAEDTAWTSALHGGWNTWPQARTETRQAWDAYLRYLLWDTTLPGPFTPEPVTTTAIVVAAPPAGDRCTDPPEVSCADAACPVHGHPDHGPMWHDLEDTMILADVTRPLYQDEDE